MRIIRIIKIAFCGLLLGATSVSVFAQTSNPISDTIAPGALTLRIVDWIQVPYSDTPPTPPRINLAFHARDNSGRLFVNDQRGYLYVIDNDVISLYLDAYAVLPNALTDDIFGTGFHGFTFHPNFASNGKFYTVHMEPWLTAPADLGIPGTLPWLDSIVTEWTALDPSSNVFDGSKREMLRIEQPFLIHTIQDIGFNPNSAPGDPDYGMLYIAQGDGGILDTDRAQSLAVAHGSILRIDPAGTDGGNGGYGIPPDNPFAADADPDTLGEIWAYGLRNPHRFSWDTGGSGVMLIGDIGEKNIEEINIGEPGRNYGWNLREGTFRFDIPTPAVVYPLPADDALNNFTYPVVQYDHDDGFAMVGGFVYRGSA
ncbi:MAG: sugar dehydrogenase, partial [Gammaproteobacteria bacterium]|nr:sugar dehydrogenase [Gammaproteobacteria bacterium]